jgi:hypothetical protein
MSCSKQGLERLRERPRDSLPPRRCPSLTRPCALSASGGCCPLVRRSLPPFREILCTFAGLGMTAARRSRRSGLGLGRHTTALQQVCFPHPLPPPHSLFLFLWAILCVTVKCLKLKIATIQLFSSYWKL